MLIFLPKSLILLLIFTWAKILGGTNYFWSKKNAFKKCIFFKFWKKKLHQLQMPIAQSFAYVERFLAPVLNTLDKNLFQYGFGFLF